MDYGTRVAWMLEEDDDAPVFLPVQRSTSTRFTSDVRLSAALPTTLQSTANDANCFPSPSSSAPSSYRSPRVSSAGLSGGGVLVSTGSMVSRYEKVMRASFRSSSDVRATPKQQHHQHQHQPETHTPAPRTTQQPASPPAAITTKAMKTASAQQPLQPSRLTVHRPAPPLNSPLTSRTTHTFTSPTRAGGSSAAEEEKQQVSFMSTPLQHPSSPLTLADALQPQPHSPLQPQHKRHETLTSTDAVASLSTTKLKPAVDRPKVRPATPVPTRWMKAQQYSKQKQDEREAVWTERFMQEVAERQKQRLSQNQQQQQPTPSIERQTKLATMEMQSAHTSTVVPEVQVARVMVESASHQLAASAPTPVRPPAPDLPEDCTLATEAELSDSNIVDSAAGDLVEGPTATKRWATIRLRTPISASTTERVLEAISEEKSETCSVGAEAIGLHCSPVATEEVRAGDNAEQAAVTDAQEQTDVQLSSPSPNEPHCQALFVPTRVATEQQQHTETTVAIATDSSSSCSSSDSGSATPVQLRSCLGGADRRRSSEGNVSRRVRWVDWDVD